MPSFRSFLYWITVILCIQQNMVEVPVCDFWNWNIKTLGFPLLSLGLLTLEKDSCRVAKVLECPLQRPLLVKNWGLLPKASISLPDIWMSHLGSRPFSPSEAFQWPHLNWHLDRDLVRHPEPEVPLNYSWIPHLGIVWDDKCLFLF